MPDEIRFRFLVSNDVVDGLAKAMEGSVQEERQHDAGQKLALDEDSFQIDRETVVGQSISGLSALIVAIGGGKGLAAVVRALAKAVAKVCAKNPHAEVIFDDKGRPRKFKGYSTAEIIDVLHASALQSHAAENVVRAFETGDDRRIRDLYDSTTGEYFAPGLGTRPFLIGDPRKAPPDGRQLTAFLDTGVMTHHPWIKGRIRKSMHFAEDEDDIEDYNGHGTLVVLTFLQTIGQLQGTLEGCQLMIVKVLNKDKTGREQDLKAGIEWAAENGATLINLSLGIYRPNGCAPDCELCTLVEKLGRTGIHFSIAAGNDPNRLSCPHPRATFAFKIGSATADGALADYSGPGVDFVIREPPGLRKLPPESC